MRPEMDGLPPPYGKIAAGPQWFHHADLILGLIDKYRPVDCVELGTYLGGSAIAIARVIGKWGGRLTCVDVWDNDATVQQCADNFVTFGVAADIAMVRASTHVAPTRWHQMIDFLYIDADHSYPSTLADLTLWWPFIKPGGVVCGDGYGRVENEAAKAWDEFEATHNQVFDRDVTPNVPGHLVWGVKR